MEVESLLDTSVASSCSKADSPSGWTAEKDVGGETKDEVEKCHRDAPVKKSRRNSVRKPRTKGLVKKLQEQIEFYFGDSNLSKDRFLHQKIQETKDGYVAVDIIADFKKMRSLTVDRSLILKAIQNSSLVELSGNGQSLRRCHPLPAVSQSDVDQRTVYVEKFPAEVTDHESVSKMFREFGEVCYVSLPKFKNSGAIKGFAFVEFTTKESALKAIEYFRVKDELPPDIKKRKPSKVLRALTKDDLVKISEEMETEEVNDELFVSEEKHGAEASDMERAKNGIAAPGHLDEYSELSSSVEENKVLKRDRTEDEGRTVNEGIKKKKDEEDCVSSENAAGVSLKEAGSEDLCVSNKSTDDCAVLSQHEDSSGRKRTRVGTEQQVERKVTDDPEDTLSVPTEKRHKQSGDEEENDAEEGLKLERERAEHCEAHGADMDGYSKKDDGNGGGGEEGGQSKHDKGGERGGKRKRHRTHRKKPWGLALRDMDLRVMSKSEWSQMKETFRNMQKENFKKLKAMAAKTGEDNREQAKPKKGFVKDCLVKVGLHKECEEHTKDVLKELCEKFGEVAFMDLKEGDTEGYVRFKSSGCIEGLVQSDSVIEGVCLQPMNEEEERAYYLKTMAERKQKFKMNKKKMNQRGKDKLISKALKGVPSASSPGDITSSTNISTSQSPYSIHIKFSDSDDSDLEAE